MKLLFKILLFLLAILQTNISEAKVAVFDSIVSEVKFTVQNIQNKNESTLISENAFGISCKSESKLVDYRNLVLVVKARAAKGGGSLVNLTEETFSQALFKGAENVGGYSVYGTKGLVGSIFNRNIFLLEASGGKSLSGFRSFVGSLEAEGLGAGANKISIYGSSVINKGFLNPNIATRFGYSFQQSGSGMFLQKVIK
jgi:hypothetical protein